MRVECSAQTQLCRAKKHRVMGISSGWRHGHVEMGPLAHIRALGARPGAAATPGPRLWLQQQARPGQSAPTAHSLGVSEEIWWPPLCRLAQLPNRKPQARTPNRVLEILPA